MKYNGTTIPTGRDVTYDPSEIHRKDAEEQMDSAFNDDQKAIIDDISSNVSGLTASISGIEEAIDDIEETIEGMGSGVNPLIMNVTEYDTPPAHNEPLVLDTTGEDAYAAFISGQPVLLRSGFETESVESSYVTELYSVVSSMTKGEETIGDEVKVSYAAYITIASTAFSFHSNAEDPYLTKS